MEHKPIDANKTVRRIPINEVGDLVFSMRYAEEKVRSALLAIEATGDISDNTKANLYEAVAHLKWAIGRGDHYDKSMPKPEAA